MDKLDIETINLKHKNLKHTKEIEEIVLKKLKFY